MRLVQLCVVILFHFTLVSCSNTASYCDRLAELVYEESVSKGLVTWVDGHLPEPLVELSSLEGGGGMWPRLFRYPKAYSRDSIGFGPDSQVRVVGKVSGDRFEIQSVYFGERTRQGLLVRQKQSETFGVPSQDIAVSLGRVAVVCRR